MRLRIVSLIYAISTSTVIAAPFAIRAIDNARRAAIPVNSEPALESPPPFNSLLDYKYSSPAQVACISPDGSEYYEAGSEFFMRDEASTKRVPIAIVEHFEFGACSVATDGTMYVLGVHDQTSYWLNAYSRTDQLRWSLPVEETRSSLAIGADGTVYLVSSPRNGSTSLKAYGEDGQERWKLPLGGTGPWLIAPGIGPDGTVYAVAEHSDQSIELVAVMPDGHERWRSAFPALAFPLGGNLIIGKDGRVFVQLVGRVLTVDSQGRNLWEFQSQTRSGNECIALADDGTLYLESRFLYALDSNGKLKWTFKPERSYTAGESLYGCPVLAEDGTIYAVGSIKQLYAITANGRKKWMFGGEAGQPTLTTGGLLLTGSGWLRVSSGLAKGGWPTQNHDNRNSRLEDQ
jgi:outer membrane protein assembly factor BamB